MKNILFTYIFSWQVLFFFRMLLEVHATTTPFAYQNTIDIDGQDHLLVIKDGKEPIDAVYHFLKNHNLDQNYRTILMNDICKRMNCNRSKAKLWSTPVNKENKFIGTFDLYEGMEPVDAAHEFVISHNLTVGYRHAILEQACSVTECNRLQPMIWNKVVDVGTEAINLQVLEGEEVSDKIFEVMLPYKVSYKDRERIITAAIQEGVPHTRRHALLLSRYIVFKEANFNKTLEVYDDGREPIDLLNEFVENNGIEHMLEKLAEKILPRICSLVNCVRVVPVVWSHQVTTHEGHLVGLIEVVKNEEPVDAVDRFVTHHKMSGNEMLELLKFLCRTLSCSRDRPVVYRQQIHDENQKKIGDIEILDSEEVIDGVFRFLRTINTTVDEIALKNYLFSNACQNKRVKCTRNIAHIFENNISDKDGQYVGQLIITELEEPADKVFQFCKDKNLDFDTILNDVCSDNFVLCRRRNPLLVSIPLNDPDGKLIGNVEIEAKVEPVDALYIFFAKHNLFQKQWNFQGVLDQVCAYPGLSCSRKRAIKFASKSITMGGKEIGPLTIWDSEEVIDVLFQKRLQFNLTVSDQMGTFSKICTQQEIYCERTQAKVFEMTGISKKDYEKFGNETCHRKYAGWQFLESFVASSLGSKARDLFKLESVEKSLGSPLFSPLILCLIMSITRALIRLPCIRHKIHNGHRIVIYFTTFLLISLCQAMFIEPKGEIDHAMHIHEGLLPDIVILENEEPVDIILRWGRLASKDHHPIVRESIYWDILSKICDEIKCKRLRAWEYIDMGSIAVSGQSYKIDYYNPNVEPIGRKLCGGKNNRCIEKAAKSFCERIRPVYSECLTDLTNHMSSQLEEYESHRLDQKDTYVKLGLEMDALSGELYPRMATIARSNGMNIVPYNSGGNHTHPLYYEWDTRTKAAYAAMDAHYKVRDPESREWNDKPCTPYFGGALCAKNDKDGNMIIEV